MTARTSGQHAELAPVILSGYVLRSFLLLALRDAGSRLTVAELVDVLRREGCVTQGRASKDISDALRWEVGRGRVRRVARSTYVLGHLPRQTAWRMRRRLDDHCAIPGLDPGRS
ncbi:MAG TPA: hypothetical protein VJ978_04315 [Nitriliruptoraceae bacterium]|nr:hypothetical protein [Nitriliruptoraceae bacterium]